MVGKMFRVLATAGLAMGLSLFVLKRTIDYSVIDMIKKIKPFVRITRGGL
jgi:hypothetical protein